MAGGVSESLDEEKSPKPPSPSLKRNRVPSSRREMRREMRLKGENKKCNLFDLDPKKSRVGGESH